MPIETIMLLSFWAGIFVAIPAAWCFKRYSEAPSRPRLVLAYVLMSCAFTMIAIPAFIWKSPGPTLVPAVDSVSLIP